MKRKTVGAIIGLALLSGTSLYWGSLAAQQPFPPNTPGLPAQPSQFQLGANPGIQISNFSPYWNDPRHEQQRAELAELDQKTHKIAAELIASPDEKKEAELKKLVEEYFDKRHAAQVAEMKVLADKLAKMQELLKKREQKKDEILAPRVKQLLGETDDLDWELTTQRPGQFQWDAVTPKRSEHIQNRLGPATR